MPTKSRYYVLTRTAEEDFRQARKWSMARWGKELALQYFADLHKGAENLAKNHTSIGNKEELTGIAGLNIAAVREHYIVYVPLKNKLIAIVALIRQTRDVPEILAANSFIIRRELDEILDKLASGKISH